MNAASNSYRAALADTLEALYRETSAGEWETRFYSAGGGSTIATPEGFLLPTEKDSHCLSSADLCFIVEMRKAMPQILEALRSDGPNETLMKVAGLLGLCESIAATGGSATHCVEVLRSAYMEAKRTYATGTPQEKP